MSTSTTAYERPSPMTFLEPPAIDLCAALGVVPPSEHDVEALLDAWDAEDNQGDPEEQRRSLALLMRLLEEDRA